MCTYTRLDLSCFTRLVHTGNLMYCKYIYTHYIHIYTHTLYYLLHVVHHIFSICCIFTYITYFILDITYYVLQMNTMYTVKCSKRYAECDRYMYILLTIYDTIHMAVDRNPCCHAARPPRYKPLSRALCYKPLSRISV